LPDQKQLDLRQIIEQCQQGNALAWEALIKSYQAKLYGVALYFLRNKADAEDVTQEAFVKIYRRLDSYRSEQQSFVPWMLAITRNCCLDHIRKSKTRSKHENELEQSEENYSDGYAGPETLNSEQQRKKLMYEALDSFSDTNRDILLLKDIQGLKIEEVAEILSLPAGTVKSRSNRARIKLAKMLPALSGDKTRQSGAI